MQSWYSILCIDLLYALSFFVVVVVYVVVPDEIAASLDLSLWHRYTSQT